jgi:hypothetical protein
MARRKHLPEGEIQRLERMEEPALEAHLESLTPAARATKFHELLVAYRLSARVANRAFAFMKEPTFDRKDALEAALADYAPEHFEDRADGELGLLMDFYNRLEAVGTDPKVLELVYETINAAASGVT